jgi:DNA-directed RNA polymerase specialized sigma24 family protein
MLGRDDVTHWLELLKAGDHAAAQPLWERYFEQLVRHARAKLPPGGGASDVVASAFGSFCLGVTAGRFPKLSDRYDLWNLLVCITGQKLADHLERQAALKRGGKFTRLGDEVLEMAIGREPTPEFAAMLADELQRLLDRLGDNRLVQIAVWKMEGYTNEEIATIAGCSLRTISNKLILIRKIFKTGS